jgi:hypothetical protein
MIDFIFNGDLADLLLFAYIFIQGVALSVRNWLTWIYCVITSRVNRFNQSIYGKILDAMWLFIIIYLMYRYFN